MQQGKRPILLMVLSALSAFYIVFYVFQTTSNIGNEDYLKNEYFTDLEEKQKELDPEEEGYGETIEMYEIQRQLREAENKNFMVNNISLLLVYLIGFAALFLMFRYNFIGFQLYVLYCIAELGVKLMIWGSVEGFTKSFILPNLIISLAFISGYYSVFLKLKKEKEDA